MFETLKMKVAADRIERENRARRNRLNGIPNFWACVWYIICWPFRKIWQFLCWLWRIICGINVIGLLNAVLLVAIIVLCSMLILDIINFRRKPVVIVTDPVPASVIAEKINVPVIAEPVTKPVNASASDAQTAKDDESLSRYGTLPIKRDRMHRMVGKPIRVVKPQSDPVAERQTARINNKMFGDIVIDSRGAATMLSNGTEINGNLYLQNMRKYVLPCNIKITGSMFIRDVNMLQFCGDFDITGNIYVSPRSSFGPIPTNSRLGGQVIL
ncbi:MAG: hypothetical protein J6W40_05000 [Alphaproteobacteria bacterium]|nr:hypothetical protein [Alphaproteobacteria bacterium]